MSRFFSCAAAELGAAKPEAAVVRDSQAVTSYVGRCLKDIPQSGAPSLSAADADVIQTLNLNILKILQLKLELIPLQHKRRLRLWG